MKSLILNALLLTLTLFIYSCSMANKSDMGTEKTESHSPAKSLDGLSKAYFGSGCFWCVEAIFESVEGVEEAVSGYAGGQSKNPTYKEVSSGSSRHAEVVAVYYNPQEVSYETLLEVFFGSHNPTTFNRQGPDAGPQYRSIILHQNEEEKEKATQYMAELSKSGKWGDDPITTEIVPLDVFYKAEEYHQDYERKHPNNPYVKGVSIPRLRKFQKAYPQLLKKEH